MKKSLDKDGMGKMKTKTYFVVFLNARSTLELMLCNRKPNKVSISNFVQFRLQSMSSKVEQAFEEEIKVI